jgi:CRP-like cAMP-binding protein
MSGQTNGYIKAAPALDTYLPSIGLAPAISRAEGAGANELPLAAQSTQSGWPDAPPSGQMRIGKHRSLFRAGEKAEHFFEVESGAVMVHRNLRDGRRQLVEIVFPGGFCGLTTGDRHESDCETLTPTVVRSYQKAELTRSHRFCGHVLERLQRQLLSLHDHIVALGRLTAEERVCTFVLRLLESEASTVESGGPTMQYSVSLPLIRSEIADYLGLTLGTVCRTFTDLQRRNLLAPGGNKSEIRAGVPAEYETLATSRRPNLRCRPPTISNAVSYRRPPEDGSCGRR